MANSLVTAGGWDTPAASSTPETADSKPDRRVWMYRAGEARIFFCPEDVPAGQGWVDHPAKVAAAAPQEPVGSEGNLTPIEKARAALAAKRARLKADQEALEREEHEASA